MHAAPDSSARRRFLNEARTAAGLHHTHIVPVFDVGQVGGLCYYAMQRIEGSGLDWVVRHLRRSRPPVPGGGGGPASGRFLTHDAQGASGYVVDQLPAGTPLDPRVVGMAQAAGSGTGRRQRDRRAGAGDHAVIAGVTAGRSSTARMLALRARRFDGVVG